MRLSSRLVSHTDLTGEITALNVIEVPRQISLRDLQSGQGGSEIKEERRSKQRALMNVAMEFTDKEDVIVNPRVVYSRDKVQTIYNTTAQPDGVDFLIMGWQGHLNPAKIFYSGVKSLIRNAPCSVGVLKSRGLKKFSRCLVPYRGSKHALWAVEVAQRLVAENDKSEIVVLRVIDEESDTDAEYELAKSELGQLADASQVQIKVVNAEHPVDGILEESQSREYDLILMGASEEWVLKNLLFGSIPDVVADRTDTSVLMVRHYDESVARRINQNGENSP